MSFIARAGVVDRPACNQAIVCEQVKQTLGGLGHGRIAVRQDIALSRGLRAGLRLQVAACKIGRLAGQHGTLLGHRGPHKRQRVHLFHGYQPVWIAILKVDQPAEQELRQLAQAARLGAEGLEVLLKGGLLEIQDDARPTPRKRACLLGVQNVTGNFQNTLRRDVVDSQLRKHPLRIGRLRATRHRKKNFLGRHARAHQLGRGKGKGIRLASRKAAVDSHGTRPTQYSIGHHGLGIGRVHPDLPGPHSIRIVHDALRQLPPHAPGGRSLASNLQCNSCVAHEYCLTSPHTSSYREHDIIQKCR